MDSEKKTSETLETGKPVDEKAKTKDTSMKQDEATMTDTDKALKNFKTVVLIWSGIMLLVVILLSVRYWGKLDHSKAVSAHNVTTQEDLDYIDELTIDDFYNPEEVKDNLDKYAVITAEEQEYAKKLKIDANPLESTAGNKDAVNSDNTEIVDKDALVYKLSEYDLAYNASCALDLSAEQTGNMKYVKTFYKYITNSNGDRGLFSFPAMTFNDDSFMTNIYHDRSDSMNIETNGVNFRYTIRQLGADETIQSLVDGYVERCNKNRDYYSAVNEDGTFGYFEYNYTKDDYNRNNLYQCIGRIWLIPDKVADDKYVNAEHTFNENAIIEIVYEYSPVNDEQEGYSSTHEEFKKVVQKYFNKFGVEYPQGLYDMIY